MDILKIPISKIKVQTVLITMIVLMPFIVDQLNGFIKFELNSNFSVSQIYKSLVIFFMAGSLLLRNNSYSVKLFTLIAGMGVITLVPWFVGSDFNPEMNAFKIFRYNLRLLFMPISYLYFVDYFKRVEFSESLFYRYLEVVFHIFLIAIFFSLLGFGIPTYAFYLKTTGETIGYSGYFISTNEIGGVLLTVFGFIIYRHFIKKRSLYYIITTILMSMLIGTKTMFLSVIIILILTIYYKRKYFHETIKNIKFKKSWVYFGLAGIIGAMVFGVVFYDFIAPSVNRIIHKYQTHPNLLTFLTSSRTTRIIPTFSLLLEEANWANYLFGFGYDTFYKLNISLYEYFGTIEMDIFDLLGIVGIIGTLFVYSFWLRVYQKIARTFKRKVSDLSIPLRSSFILIFILSFITGHIFQSSLGGILFGFVFAYNSVITNNESTDSK